LSVSAAVGRSSLVVAVAQNGRGKQAKEDCVVNGRVAVIYYSATGNVHGLAQAVADGAEEAGAEVRRRHVEELASELLISQNQYSGRHRSIVSDEPVATLDDLEWADGVAFGTPTRFGNVAAQLKQFIDQAGGSGRKASSPTRSRRRSPHRRPRTAGRSRRSSRSTRPSTTGGW
jgi:multimeric flavodoxin WrbA